MAAPKKVGSRPSIRENLLYLMWYLWTLTWMGSHACVPAPSANAVRGDFRCGLKVLSFITHQTRPSFSGNMRCVHTCAVTSMCVIFLCSPLPTLSLLMLSFRFYIVTWMGLSLVRQEGAGSSLIPHSSLQLIAHCQFKDSPWIPLWVELLVPAMSTFFVWHGIMLSLWYVYCIMYIRMYM